MAFELYTAARTDADLRTALAPVLDEHRKNLRAQACRLFPEAARDPGFEDAVDTILAAMQGSLDQSFSFGLASGRRFLLSSYF